MINKHNAAEFITLIEALSRGEIIQFFSDGKWFDGTSFVFNQNSCKYRIKPKPKIKYKVGQKFKRILNEDTYMLVYSDTNKTLSFIHLNSGFTLGEPQKISDLSDITEDHINNILENRPSKFSDFVAIEDYCA